MNNLNPSPPKKPFRVLFVAFYYLIDVYQRRLEIASRTGNVEIGLLTPRKWFMREWNQTFIFKPHYSGIQFFPANVWFLNGRQGGYLYPLSTILKAIFTFKPDIIQMDQEVFSLATFEMALIARIFKIPLVIFCWENMDKDFSFIRQFTRQFVFDTAKVINPGTEEAAQLIRKWGYKGTIEVIEKMGVDIELFHPLPGTKKERPFSIGYVGRLVQEKGIDLIFLAANELIKKGYEFRVIICGNGPEEGALRHLADQIQLTNRIVWLGPFPYKDIPRAFSEMDVLVLPSRTLPGKWKEQFGHVLVEAMAMGVPVIGSSSGAIPDVIGRSDLVFLENDVSGLTLILEKMITDEPWREQLSQYGSDRVLKEFSHEVVAEKMTELWEGIIGR